MVQRFLEQQVTIHAMLSDDKVKRRKDFSNMNKLSAEDVHRAEQFVELIEPMLTAAQAMGGEKKSTVRLVLPLLQKLKKSYAANEKGEGKGEVCSLTSIVMMFDFHTYSFYKAAKEGYT